jgi:ribosomal protein S30
VLFSTLATPTTLAKQPQNEKAREKNYKTYKG